MPRELIQLTENELKEYNPESTLVLIAVGGLEPHGPHLPLGTDLFLTQYGIEQVAERIEKEFSGWRVITLPAIAGAIEAVSNQGALTIRPHVLRDFLVDQCSALHRSYRLRYFAALTETLGPKTLTTLEEVGRFLRVRSKVSPLRSSLFSGKSAPYFMSLSSGMVSPEEVRRSPFVYYPREHGGQIETSKMIHVQKEYVRGLYENLPEIEPASLKAKCFKRVDSYYGKPALADGELGSRIIDAKVESILSNLKKVLIDQIPPERVFRSWYSVIPSNKSLFKAWTMFVGVLFFFGAVIWMSLVI